MYSIRMVEGFSCPSKIIIMKDKEPMIVCDSKIRAGKIISYISGNDNADIPDNLKAKLNKYKEELK